MFRDNSRSRQGQQQKQAGTRAVLLAAMIIALIRQCQPDKMCALQWFVSIMEKKEAGSAGNGTGGKNLPSPRQPAQH